MAVALCKCFDWLIDWLRKLTWLVWWMQSSAEWPPTVEPSQSLGPRFRVSIHSTHRRYFKLLLSAKVDSYYHPAEGRRLSQPIRYSRCVQTVPIIAIAVVIYIHPDLFISPVLASLFLIHFFHLSPHLLRHHHPHHPWSSTPSLFHPRLKSRHSSDPLSQILPSTDLPFLPDWLNG